MKRTIKNPYWGNREKTQVVCEFHYEDGPIQTAAITDTQEGNPDWKELFEIFTTKQIDDFTEKALAEAREEHEKRKQFEKDDIERMKVDALFSAKLEAFEIDLVKNSKNRELKSRIRKAKSIMEITAFTAALITLEYEK
jgi:elongation factor P--beta-lysine ligase